MFVKDVIGYIECWSPPEAAMKSDSTGLQLGDPGIRVTNILVALEVTDRIIDEAIENQVNLILSHHPLIYNPLERLDTTSWLGRKIARLIKHDIAVYSAHTNLDAANPGVSIELARILGVQEPRFLTTPENRWMKKIAVFVPASHLDAVRDSMTAAGAGNIGDYSNCSFNIAGTGTFLGGEAASPSVGKKGNLETVDEIRLEMILPEWKVKAVVNAMRAAHPYEETACDIYNLDNYDVNFGFGAIGEFPEPIPLHDFIETVKEKLGVKALSVMEGPATQVSRLAVCGGSGGELAGEAWRQGAEVFIAGEIKYHSFLEFEDRMTVIAAGHYATERVILPVWTQKIQDWIGDSKISVIETKLLTNPVKYII